MSTVKTAVISLSYEIRAPIISLEIFAKILWCGTYKKNLSFLENCVQKLYLILFLP